MDMWSHFTEECLNCSRCNLSNTRTNVVVGDGPLNSNIMFVAEAPGFNEDKAGHTFLGNSGKLFDKMLESINLSRDSVYITNIVKCRPPENRSPNPYEINCCLPLLREQFKFIRPEIIVCLGRVSATTIIDKNFKITRDHGKWIERAGCNMIATFHPSALLRNPDKKYDAYEDLKKIRAKLDSIVKKDNK